MGKTAYLTFDNPKLKQTVEQWKVESPHGACFAMVAEADKHNVPTLQSLFNDQGYPLIGAMFPELIVNARFERNGVILLHLENKPYYNIVSMSSNEHIDKAISEWSNAILQNLPPRGQENSLFLVMDSMIPNVATILDRIYLQLSNKVQYFGVNAGSETFQPASCIFDNHQWVGNSFLSVLFDQHPGGVLSHNYREPAEQITATSTQGNLISSIEWRPAFEVYQELVKKQYGVAITKDNFYEYGVHFPFGISRMDGEPLVRIPVALQEDGSLYCVGEVPPNTLLTLLDAIHPGSLETVDCLARNMDHSDNSLCFYCAGRRMHLGDMANGELSSLGQRLQGQIVGALSLGEIGSSSSGGYPLFHNAALVMSPLQ
ncbi:MAG: FIST C-terminal domain-containing protein [Gammaproteobacteria bacterium]|nr:FIST C-terminal domain-containing protein [Gammaproteobacteria bacterium]MDH5799616.1 FIST C-terminal domain-containing protein [Gammaproteobacteria bacterium]